MIGKNGPRVCPWRMWALGWLAVIGASVPLSAIGAEPATIVVAADQRGFVLRPSGKPFVPWGFNYDRDFKGRLLEDFWVEEWSAVETAFRQMRQLGANVVRIHLQFGRFMTQADQPNPAALAQLSKLLELSEKTGLFLDLTGLGCYHAADVPSWYDSLSEADRWQAQAAFWEAIAKTCADSPAVFCYDLMNEPVVAGGDQPQPSWLGPAFAGKHYVQFIARDRAGRDRPTVARAWIRTLVAAIRRHDRRHLITVGLVDWSLDRPGLTSGFVPTKIAAELDFVAVHLYPKRGQLEEAADVLKEFAAVGKPVVIEETYPLQCSPEEFREFLTRSRAQVSGWIGFYWGESLEDLQGQTTLPAALQRNWLTLFQQLSKSIVGE